MDQLFRQSKSIGRYAREAALKGYRASIDLFLASAPQVLSKRLFAMRNFYYLVKPLVPWRVRMALRRLLAARLRAQSEACWPILRSAARVPSGWPGWPDGKQFAFVLTHDVEGEKGLEQCRQLAEVDKACGFRSSFNFVPEGEYRLPDSVRTFLKEEGFEVGVHDLHHDGSLYRSSESFHAQAKQINEYLKAWGATGFRAGFMFHNLEWIKTLEVSYDASTFDTDPFEPQPDGVGTIFPFWVQTHDTKGYIELPYTLPQDSTMFLLLQEQTIDVWVKKLDWVAEHGGMVLVNVHPDYIAFQGKARTGEFPVALYEGLLKYVATRYGDRCWHALPRDVAAYAAQFKPTLNP